MGLTVLELLETSWMHSSSLSNGAACWMQGYQRLHARAIEEFEPELVSQAHTPGRHAVVQFYWVLRRRQDMARHG